MAKKPNEVWELSERDFLGKVYVLDSPKFQVGGTVKGTVDFKAFEYLQQPLCGSELDNYDLVFLHRGGNTLGFLLDRYTGELFYGHANGNGGYKTGYKTTPAYGKVLKRRLHVYLVETEHEGVVFLWRQR